MSSNMRIGQNEKQKAKYGLFGERFTFLSQN